MHFEVCIKLHMQACLKLSILNTTSPLLLWEEKNLTAETWAAGSEK